MSNWHIIKEYTTETNTITCACGWFGDAGQGVGDITCGWFVHRKSNRNDPQPAGFNKKDFVYGAANHRMGLKLNG